MMGRMIRKIALALGAGALIAASPAAFALDGASVELGRGDDRTNLLRISFVDKWRKKQPPAGAEWRLAGYWDLSFAVWDNPDESTAEAGFTPRVPHRARLALPRGRARLPSRPGAHQRGSRL